jgi:hypothetical protein
MTDVSGLLPFAISHLSFVICHLSSATRARHYSSPRRRLSPRIRGRTFTKALAANLFRRSPSQRTMRSTQTRPATRSLQIQAKGEDGHRHSTISRDRPSGRDRANRRGVSGSLDRAQRRRAARRGRRAGLAMAERARRRTGHRPPADSPRRSDSGYSWTGASDAIHDPDRGLLAGPARFRPCRPSLPDSSRRRSTPMSAMSATHRREDEIRTFLSANAEVFVH